MSAPSRSTPRNQPHLHEAFLHRAAQAGDTIEQQLAMGGYLVLRLVDQFRTPDICEGADALDYQLRATAEFVRGLPSNAIECKHQRQVVAASTDAAKSGHTAVLWPPLLAYAYWLEKDLELAAALDVLETVLAMADAAPAADLVATLLQHARVLRLMGRLESATAGYTEAGKRASEIGDRHSELVSQIGRAIVLQKTGNLPASETILRSVLEHARAEELETVEAMAAHDLAIALHLGGRAVDAVPLAFLAYERYQDSASRLRALSDTAVLLKELGEYDAANHALLSVLGHGPPPEVRSRVLVELIELAGLVDDRVAFQRWRRDVSDLIAHLPPDELCNYELAVGRGLAAFGSLPDAEQCYERALAVAEQYKLGERLFKAENALRDLRERRAVGATPPEPVTDSPQLLETIDRVKALAVTPS